MDSSLVSDAKTGIDLAISAYFAITALVGFIAGKFVKFRKKK